MTSTFMQMNLCSAAMIKETMCPPLRLLAALLLAPLSVLATSPKDPDSGDLKQVKPFALPPPAQPVPAKIDIAGGSFKPNWESLQQYKCPEWFRDAKLGFWGILDPQSQAEADGWYARTMYIEGERPYLFHREHFGHPSQFGFKDLAVRWKADRFEPDRLVELYKRAGAKYFVVLGTFHDNWDNWNSKYHRWNSVNVGPHKDIVGLWAAAVRKQGLRFGVSEHLERSYSWFNTNKGSDKQGKYAGVPYDGNDPEFADLYFPPHEDTNVAYPKNPPEWWPREWFWRIRDLVDSYQPDLLYTDGAVPFDATGRSLIAHFYNANTTWHGGKLEAVYNIKDMNHRVGHDHGEYVDGIAVQDVERGGLPDIKSTPWLTDEYCRKPPLRTIEFGFFAADCPSGPEIPAFSTTPRLTVPPLRVVVPV